MKKTLRKEWCQLVVLTVFLVPVTAFAQQREVHWQVNPRGFPGNVSAFVDVETGGAFKRDLTAAAFAIGMDQYVGDQGGYILNQQQVVAGQAGAEVLILVDKSSSYTNEFDKAKRIVKSIIGYMDPARDHIAIATAPATGGFQEANLDVPFSNDPAMLNAAVDGLKHLPSKDKTGARICNAIAEGLKYFPEQPGNRYRALVFITGGADKGEGKGDCVQSSYVNGLVPFFPIVFKLDKKYDDPRNSHKIENKTHELAQKTGGRSIFRQNENSYKQFVGLFWNRIRSQYHLQVMFPCYKPQPIIEHYATLKVEGRDADPIKFQATSVPAPVPTITAFYPQQASRKDVDDGKIMLTVDGTGFCGPPGSVKVLLKDVQAKYDSHTPFRAVSKLHSGHGTGIIKVVNQFGQVGESQAKFQIVKPPKGAKTMGVLTYLVGGIVALALLSIVIVAFRSRKAKPGAAAKAIQKPRMSDKPSAESGAAKTMAMTAVEEAWVEMKDGAKVNISPGFNVIGREDTCQITLTVPGVSREHARIDFDKAHGLLWVEDMGSMNGTFLGKGGAPESEAAKLEKRQLVNSGDTLWIGGAPVVIRFKGGTQGKG